VPASSQVTRNNPAHKAASRVPTSSDLGTSTPGDIFFVLEDERATEYERWPEADKDLALKALQDVNRNRHRLNELHPGVVFRLKKIRFSN